MSDVAETPGADAAPISIRNWLVQNALTLSIVAAAIGYALWREWDFLLIGRVILGLGFVIFIHELGHFLAAKWCDVHVETFSIGFGPALPGCSTQIGETRYMLALLPLGGYVKMVGEGADGEDGEDDPRSFKNKTVGQRMLIISAGVIMNVILAAVCYVAVFMTAGVERTAGVVGLVDSGSPAWKAGLRPGAVLTRVGTIDNPYFNIDIMPEVMHWPTGEPMPVWYEVHGQTIQTTVTPKKFDGPGRQMIGIGQPFSTRLLSPNRLKLPPYIPGSAASRATPELLNGDLIVGSSDPDQPDRTKPLPPDPRTTQPDRLDHHELTRRFEQLAGRPVDLVVQRVVDGRKAELTVSLPPAFHANTGLVMQMGPVAAIRRDSPAERAGIRAKDAGEPGDIIDAIELPQAAGRVLRITAAPSAQADPNVDERTLDPVRLPFELRRWAQSQPPGAKKVRLVLARQVEHKERKEVRVDVDWDDSWTYERSSPSGENSPLAIDELGLAYAVLSAVRSVAPDSGAAGAGLQPGDIIKEVGFFDPRSDASPPKTEWRTIELGQWANAHWLLQAGGNLRRMAVRFARSGAVQEAAWNCEPDTSWPLVERGLRFDYDTRLQRADSFFGALMMGGRDTLRQIGVIYNNLFAMVTNKVSFRKNASGPIMIAAVAYEFAGRNLPEFILFLGMISINLAVINFLPIPVLDGGHMAFLLYEKLRGRPAPEQLRVAATFVGVALIVSLMLFVTYLDFMRL